MISDHRAPAVGPHFSVPHFFGVRQPLAERLEAPVKIWGLVRPQFASLSAMALAIFATVLRIQPIVLAAEGLNIRHPRLGADSEDLCVLGSIEVRNRPAPFSEPE